MIVKEYKFADRKLSVIVEEGKLRLNLLPTEIKLKIPSADFDYSKYEEYCQKIAEQVEYNFAIRGNFRETDIRLSDEKNKADITFTYKQLDTIPLSFCILKVSSGYLIYHSFKDYEDNWTYKVWQHSVDFFKDLSEIDDSFQYIRQIDISNISSHFYNPDAIWKDKFKVKYCWQVDRYLITLLEENNTVTIKAFYKDEDTWTASALNNANFLADIWLSFWKSEVLANCWYTQQDLENGSSDWDLTDTPITVDELFKKLYEFTDWVKYLDEDRAAGEWEIID